MEIEKLREAIAKSDLAEEFRKITINIDNPAFDFSLELNGYITICRFFNDEHKEWSKLEKTLPSSLASAQNAVKQIYQTLNTLNEKLLNGGAEHVLSFFGNSNNLRSLFSRVYSSSEPEVDFLINLHQENPEFAKAAEQYFNKSNNLSLSNQNHLIGYLKAYEFDFKSDSLIAKRSEAEEKSITQLKTKLESILQDVDSKSTDFLAKLNTTFTTKNEELAELIETNTGKANDWFSNKETESKKLSEDTKNRINSLDKYYENQLKLQKPADHWKKRASRLKVEGRVFLGLLVGLILIVSIVTYNLISDPPQEMIDSFKVFDASAIKWSILYITFISFLAFGIKSLNKAMFSSFHLARDAEEKEQLVYTYLALLKDSAVDEKDRNLVLQSIFSRADSGLLRDDSGPTMPMNIMDKIGKSG